MVDLHEAAITPGCREGLEHLRHQSFLRDFYLAGGTALALQIGHRISTDLDWFSTNRRLPAPEGIKSVSLCAAAERSTSPRNRTGCYSRGYSARM